MALRCRTCGATLPRLEVNSSGGGGLALRASPAFEAMFDDVSGFDVTSPEWLSRYLDGHPCSACGTVDLTIAYQKLYLDCESGNLPHSGIRCRSCGARCLGPLGVEGDATGEPPLAFLAARYGAPLWADLCDMCGLLWLRLHSDDAKAREQLAARFPDAGPCEFCHAGRLRVTGVDVPHSGVAGLFRPELPAGDGRHHESKCVADLCVAVCDACGGAEVRMGSRSH